MDEIFVGCVFGGMVMMCLDIFGLDDYGYLGYMVGCIGLYY